MKIIKNPSRVMLEIWGPLAHLTKKDRSKLLMASYGLFKPRMDDLEKHLMKLGYWTPGYEVKR